MLIEGTSRQDDEKDLHQPTSHLSSRSVLLQDMDPEVREYLDDLDQIIELSIRKIRRMQTGGGQKDERQRLLVLETLQGSLFYKVRALRQQGKQIHSLIDRSIALGLLKMDNHTAVSMVLADATGRLGLQIRIIVERNDQGAFDEMEENFPRLRLPLGKRLQKSMIK